MKDMASIRKMRSGVEDGLGVVVAATPGVDSAEDFFLADNE
jgi:hypothetical protein